MMRLAFMVVVLGACGGKSRATSADVAQPRALPRAQAATPVEPEAAATPDAAVAPAKSEKEAAADAEQAAYEQARPVFEAHCARCHSARGAKATKKRLGHFSIDSYPFGGHHAGNIGETVREVLGVTGKEPTMPVGKEGSVRGANLEAIVAWSKAFDAAKAAGVHGDASGAHHDHHHH